MDDFTFNKPLMTALLANQIVKQLPALESWWLSCIEYRVNTQKSKIDLPLFQADCSNEELYRFFSYWCETKKIENPFTTITSFWNTLDPLLPEEFKRKYSGAGKTTITFIEEPIFRNDMIEINQIIESMEKCQMRMWEKIPGIKKNAEQQGNYEKNKTERIEKLKEVDLLKNNFYLPEFSKIRTIGLRILENFTPVDKERASEIALEFDDIYRYIDD